MATSKDFLLKITELNGKIIEIGHSTCVSTLKIWICALMLMDQSKIQLKVRLNWSGKHLGQPRRKPGRTFA